ncbi:MGAT2 domain containing protein, partial [Asbolus verrucosus]
DFMFFVNTEQLIYNQEINESSSEIDLVIVVQVHNRLIYLKELINSLAAAANINRTLLIFSHDVYDKDINEAVQSIQFARVMQIFYPFSIQTHPDEFPGPDSDDCQPSEQPKPNCPNIHFKDTYGNFRNAIVAQLKHHWWWKINFVFNRIRALKDYFGLVLLLEEDHYVAEDFIHCLKLMENYSRESCPECWFFSLARLKMRDDHSGSNDVIIRSSVENLGLAFNRNVWYEILRLANDFCKFDDYNWDWTLRQMASKIMKPTPSSMIMAHDRIAHIGSCGTHSGNKTCDASAIIKKFKEAQVNLFPKFLNTRREDFSYNIRNNGGWKDPRDHALCIGMT